MKNTEEKKASYKDNYIYKAYRIREYMWLVFAIISVGASIYALAKSSREEAIYFIALTFLSGLFFSFNRYRRRKWEKREEEGKK